MKLETDYKTAQAIMGSNFFGVEDARHYLGVNPQKRPPVIDFREDTLQGKSDTHLLVLPLPLSVIDVRNEFPHLFHKFSFESWFEERYPFVYHPNYRTDEERRNAEYNGAFRNSEPRWSLIDKGDALYGQMAYETRVLVYSAIGHFLKTGERIGRHGNLPTSNLDRSGGRVYVGPFNEEGLQIKSAPPESIRSEDSHVLGSDGIWYFDDGS